MRTKLSLISVLLALSMMSSGLAGTVKDDFEDGIFADYWDSEPESYKGHASLVEITDADEHDGMLHYCGDAGRFQIAWLVEPISGDFEVSVEYHDYQPNLFADTKFELQIRDAADPRQNYRRLAVESGGAIIQFSGKDAGAWVDDNAVGNWSSPDGNLKMIKTGDTISAVLWDGDEEIAIAKQCTFKYDLVAISLFAQSWGGTKLTSGAFDNFLLTGDGVPDLGMAIAPKDKLFTCWGDLKSIVSTHR